MTWLLLISFAGPPALIFAHALVSGGVVRIRKEIVFLGFLSLALVSTALSLILAGALCFAFSLSFASGLLMILPPLAIGHENDWVFGRSWFGFAIAAEGALLLSAASMIVLAIRHAPRDAFDKSGPLG